MRLLRSFPFALSVADAAVAPRMEGFDPGARPMADFKLGPFYESDPCFAGRASGELLKCEPVAAPAGANAWRVMVASRTWDDQQVPVTGIVVAPKARTKTLRPVLSWCHGTTGGNRAAAPSLADKPAQDFVQRADGAPIDHGVPYLSDWLVRGFVVVASDYVGLGGPGVHHYLVGSSCARNALDIVRAAGQVEGVGAGSEVLLFGWSVGGHAALFAAEEQAAYAPQLRLRGVVVIAPSTTDFPRVHIPHVYVLARAYQDAYNVPLAGFTASGRALIDKAGEVSIFGVYAESLMLEPPFFEGDWSPAMKQALALNLPGQRRAAAPMLVVHGGDDNVVPPAASERTVARARAAGSTVALSWHEGHNHRSVIAAARGEILEWLGQRLG